LANQRQHPHIVATNVETRAQSGVDLLTPGELVAAKAVTHGHATERATGEHELHRDLLAPEVCPRDRIGQFKVHQWFW
jgi:hypothetical protein